MSNNASVLTGNTQALVEKTVEAFNEQVLTHLYGDFGAHTQVKVFPMPYLEPVSGHVVSDYSLRLLLTHPTLGEVAVILPCQPTSQTVATDGPPIFVGETSPSTQTVPAGQAAQFEVYVASTTAVRYRWQKNGADLVGQNQPLCYLPTVVAADAGLYRCTATNDFGVAVSTNGTLTVG
jgi:hypothetical protein